MPNSPTAALRQRIHQHWRCDEDDLLDSLVDAHVRELDGYARRIDHGGGEVPPTGCFFAPRAYEIDALSRLSGELDAVCAAIAATGYGLTLGIHSRIDATVRAIIERLAVGNIYVNRNHIGAVVGVQPFGGHGLSGTGPKAGGPHTFYRFAAERSVSVDTTAAGGNASLLADGE